MYTDRFGSPLNVGDKIVAAFGAGRGSAELRETEIVGIVPLIPHRDRTEPRRKYDYTTKSYAKEIEGFFYMRADQQNQYGPTEFYRPKDTPQDKLFILQYQQYGRDYNAPLGRDGKYPRVPTKKGNFERVNDVVKVPDGV